MKKLSAFFYRFSRGWVVLAALLGLVLFGMFILPQFNVRTSQFAAGVGVPDLMVSYSGKELYAMAQAYGEAGRADFVNIHWTIDLAFPIIYTIFLITGSSWLLRGNIPATSLGRLWNLLPLAAFLLDLGENAATSAVMLRFPAQAGLAQALAPLLTPLKWLFVLASFGLLLVAFVLWCVRSLARRKTQNP
jgi:hypothetical protein